MPDIQDNTHLRHELVKLIEIVWRESRAAQHVAKHYCTGENPQKLLGEARKMPVLSNQFDERFGETLSTLESAETDFLSALVSALQQCVKDYSESLKTEPK